ncbi:MAG: dockerin type I domain-containing protein [Clostridia bacterium]|nr:dockerin type I domain-containing protein [Clostridia bacterium]
MKKFIAALLSLSLIAGAAIMSHAESYYGDIDKNGSINSSDALAILKYTVGLTKSIDTKIADVNHDGAVNSSDALKVLQISIGKLPSETVKSSTTKPTTKPTTATTKKTSSTTRNPNWGPFEVGTTDVSKYIGSIKKAWKVTNVSGLNIQIARVELNKSITQKFDANINKQITNPKTITYKPTCSVALITCDTPTRLNLSKGTTLDNTENIAKNVGAVLAVNGRNGYPSNIANIRSGAIIQKYDGTEGKAKSSLVFYKDGSWKYVNNFDNTTAANEIKKGAYNTCAYQDKTIEGGKFVSTYNDSIYRNRTFLGRISATKYVLMTTEFMPIRDAADVMLAYGVKDAVQINGGNCSQMYVKGIGNTTGSSGASIKPLNKVGKLETEWFADYSLYSDNRKGGPCSHEAYIIYFK